MRAIDTDPADNNHLQHYLVLGSYWFGGTHLESADYMVSELVWSFIVK